MTDHEELLEIAELYPLGGLREEERVRIEQHMADGCARCEAALRANQNVASQLLHAVAPVEPRAEVLERLLARVSATHARKSRAPARLVRGRAAAFAIAASVLVALGLGALSAVLNARLERERGARVDLEDALNYEESISWSLVRQVESERQRRVAVEERLTGLSRVVATIEAPLVRSLALAGQGEFRAALAKAYIEPESGRLILYAHNLPPVPDGRTYQIWVIVEDEHRSAGVFRSDSQGEAKYDTGRLPDLEGPVTVAVTLEPEGGAPQPTGPVVLAGS
jgi:anti-sigma-K factor RskA